MNKKLRDRWGSGAIYSVLLVIGIASVLSLFLGQSEFPETGRIIFAACMLGLLFALFFLLLRGKMRLFILLGALGVWLIAGVLMRDQLFYGMQVASAYFAPYLSNIVHLEFTAPATASLEEALACANFLLFLAIPYSAFMAWAVVDRKSCLLSLLGTVPLFALSYGMLMRPSGIALPLLIVFWVSMIIQALVLRYDKNIRPGFSAACIALCAAVFLTVFGVLPQEKYTPSANTLALRTDISSAAADFGYTLRGLRGFPSGVPLTSSDGTVDLDSTGSVQLPDRTVLRVKSNVPQTMYLRGYSASIYTGHEWLQPEEETFRSANIPFEPLMYLGAGDVISTPNEPNLITIEPDRADSDFLFTPYLLTGIREAEPPSAWHGDSYLESSGQPSYTFETFDTYGDAFITGQSEDNLWIVQNSREYSFGSYDYKGYSFGYTVYADGGANIYTESDDVPEDIMQEVFDILMSDAQSGRLSSSDTAYLDYISKEYTQLPDGIKETLREWWAGLHDTDELSPEMQPFYMTDEDIPYSYWQTVAKLVAKEVSQSGTYTTEPGAQPRNRDFVEYFLKESNKGYCTHFASATAAMLRALGVPARYVEGYIVGEASFGNDGWAEVSANKAHAWAEIWAPGIGWVPVESTPAGAAVSQISNYEDEASANSEQTAPQPTPAPENTPAPTPVPTEPDSQNNNTQRSALPSPVLAVLILCGGIAAILLIARQAVKSRRLQSFDDPEPDRAALFLYTYLGVLEEYGADISQEATDIARKARFSKDTVSSEELASLKKEVQKNRAETLASLPVLKKIVFWFRGL